MKLVFSALVLINLGYFMWQSWYVVPPGAEFGAYAEPEINPEKMQPVAAVKKTLKRRKRSSITVSSLTDVTPPRLCYRVGPFPQEKQVLGIRKRLARHVVSAVPRQAKEPRTIYRVIIPPLPSQTMAMRVRDKLTRLGFKDHAILPLGDQKYAVSVGVFAVKSNADKRRRALKKKGITARRQTLDKSRIRHWLDIKSEDNLTKMLERQKWAVSGVHASSIDCNSKPPGSQKQAKRR